MKLFTITNTLQSELDRLLALVRSGNATLAERRRLEQIRRELKRKRPRNS